MKKRNTVDWGKTVFFLFLTVASIILLIALWDFLYLIDDIKDGHRIPLLFVALLIPLFFLYGALTPWIEYKGMRESVVSGKIMLLDENGYYVKTVKTLERNDVDRVAKAFEHDEDYRYERFTYDQYSIYLTTCKNGYWFFPDKNDKSLIRTGEPGGGLSGLYKGFRIDPEELEVIKELLSSIEDGPGE